jgi:DNA-binding transcriptional LysR family regulator
MIDAKLETLLTVTETQNYTRAAQQLSLTQPAVSQHIKQLENELGVKLFIRSGGKIILTEKGKIVVKYARRLTAIYATMLKEMHEKLGLTSLIVGITHTGVSNIIAEVIAKYCNIHEGVHIKIVTDTIISLYKKLKAYEIDLAIVEGTYPEPELNAILLDTDDLILAVSNDHPFAQKNYVTLNELKNEKIILRLPNSGMRNLFVAHLESKGMSIDEFNVILEVDNLATIKDLIARGFGIAILPKSVCLNEIKKHTLTVLGVENLHVVRETNIVYRKDFEHLDFLEDISNLYNQMLDSEK